MDTPKPSDIRMAAMNLLSRREYLRAELEQKLNRRFGADAADLLHAVLDDLARENLQCDERFLESYLRHRSARGYGPERLRQELRQKGVDSTALELALEAADIDWAQLARDARAKKFGLAEPQDFKEKARQLRFLQYRGFGGDYSAEAFKTDWDDV